ncbi:WD40-repeat-containing domain protein [Fimicolochytrium jonesii]|uniref:WD40-repeat-containing domain protein n=1 Tax=Fimicolochytrium jonesii TaxID=1396493 RepID=UPI0022FEABCA|nr:WD40-repeat-containing domain protein [Fimicolochytrium jonesii]KAI8823957.1 WD40-repeat-containing domain protein [Fimicolochytrium jonesii]
MSFTRTATYAPQPATERGRPVHLGGDPKGNNFLYTNGRSVIIRNLANPEIAKEYTQHTAQATVARYSPSGFYIASADIQGNVRIWDTINAENIIKTETRVFAGKVNDLAWDFESKRIIAVGEGKDRFGHAFLFDTASSVGEIAGHSKAVNSVDIRPGRPLRAITGSDDTSVNFYHGVPFKFNKSLNEHSRFVQCVRYSPSGEHFVSAGADGKLFLYDGKEGTKIADLSTVEGAHKGGIYSVSWSPDGKNLLSASADMTTKIWDIAAQKVVSTWEYSSTPSFDDQQVGCLWQGDHTISLSLAGDISYLNRSSGGFARTVRGHSKGITALAVKKDQTLYTGSYDGRVCSWKEAKGVAAVPSGAPHTNSVMGLAVAKGKVYSAGMDDTVRSIAVEGDNTVFGSAALSTGALPRSIAASPDTEIAVTVTVAPQVIIVKDGQRVAEVKLDYVPVSVAVAPNGKEIAIGGEDTKVHIFALEGSMKEKAVLEFNRGQVTAVAYSPDGTMLAAGDSQSKIVVYDTASHQVKLHQWVFHSGRITSISWSSDSKHAVSGSLDTNVEVWSVDKPMKHIAIKNAHLEGVSGAVFVGETSGGKSRLATAGADGFVKLWDVVHHQ